MNRQNPQGKFLIIGGAIALLSASGCGLVLLNKNNQESVDIAPARAQSSAKAPEIIVQKTQVRSLPGQLDNIPMFNSNSPEWIKKEGILLSTFPPDGKQVPEAHLNFPFEGKFELFAHHFIHTPPNLQTLYIGIIVHNPGTENVRLNISTAASYLLSPDAPFALQPPMTENPNGEVYSGPGIRAVDQVLRGVRQADFPAELVIPPGESKMLMNGAIPVKDLVQLLNGRSSFMELQSSGKVYLASLAMYAKKNPDGSERPPTIQEWQTLLNNGGFAQPRDTTPTPPDQVGGQLIYSRVAGVQQGSKWQANIVDPGKNSLTIPHQGQAFSYVISTVRAGSMGTGQIQSAKLLVRYPDTAYESHGNYGTHYDLTLPLFNPTNQPQTVSITLETPQKEERLSQGGLIFRQPPWDFPYFRGTVRIQYADETAEQITPSVTRYVHLWHRRGQVLDPLFTVNLPPGETRTVRVDFRYPPDATPPQVLTLRSL
jgi:Protein of unknown function (DUF3370)